MKANPSSPGPPSRRVILLSLGQREALEAMVRRGTTEQRIAERARMVLLRAEGIPLADIARRLGRGKRTVERKLDRYLERGMDGLKDLPRPGRPRKLSLLASSSR